MVVETEDDAVIGTVEVRTIPGAYALIVRSGLVGRPVVLDAEDVVCLVPAAEHPGVEITSMLADKLPGRRARTRSAPGPSQSTTSAVAVPHPGAGRR